MDDRERAERCAGTMIAADRASRAMGIEIAVESPGIATARMTIREDMLNGHDICHGGYVFALADTAFAVACNAYDDVTVADTASIDFIRPAKRGDELLARAEERRRGRKSGIYDIRVQNQRGEDVALFRGRSVATGKPVLGMTK